jgi:NADH-quinone oxidoreductase subunit J
LSSVLFFLGAIGAISGAVGVVMLRDPFYAVLSLVVHLISLAVLFLLLRSEFVAAVQVVVYAGAVMVLYVFVVAYVGDADGALGVGERIRSLASGGAPARGAGPVGSGMRLAAVAVGAALAIELFIAMLGSALKAIDGTGASYAPGPKTFGTPAYIGQLLLTRFLLAFEVASFLLLIAAVGALLLAGHSSSRSAASREGEGGEGEGEGAPGNGMLAGLELPPRPLGTGTMAEGVGSRRP